ncbi:hypothetical protein M422DRAFT_45878 [Sphaerobolus stellatus SS14]|nr:hypothetical protein M422DRAFT_45878 [Sphaerobolus stellatus SS14]
MTLIIVHTHYERPEMTSDEDKNRSRHLRSELPDNGDNENARPNALAVDAPLILKADACTYWNTERGHCISIISVNTRRAMFKVLIYHPHTWKVFLTDFIPGLSVKNNDGKLLGSTKRVSEIFFSVILSAYSNAFEVFLMVLEGKATKGARQDSISQLDHAPDLGHKAASKVKERNVNVNLHICEAEEMAE